MIKRILAMTAAIASVLCLSACSLTEYPKEKVTHHSQVPPKMMFLGDSIAAGYGLDGYTSTDNYNCRSYSNILKEKYETELQGECEHIMVNKAVSGATSEELLQLIQSGELDSDLADCDAVVVSIGGNDLLGIMLDLVGKLGITEGGGFSTESLNILGAAASFMSIDGNINSALDKFSENIKLISNELNSRTDGKIFVQTLYDPLEYFTAFNLLTDFSEEKIGKLNSIINGSAQGSYTVIDVAADFKGRAGSVTNIKKFDIHPNQEGHELIANDVDAAFRASGFTYTTIEIGDKQLTAYGRAAIAAAVGMIVLLFGGAVTLILLKKDKKPALKDEPTTDSEITDIDDF